MKRSFFFGVAALLFVLACPGAPAQSVLTNMLEVYYPFSGNAQDESGNGNNGTVSGATLTADRFGRPNSAYAFDGTQSRIQIPETLFYATNSGVTVSLWVRTDTGPYTGSMCIFEKSGQQGAMELLFDSGMIKFGPKLQTYGWYNAAAPIRTNSVMHLVGVYQQGQSTSLYIDGALANSVSTPNDNLYVEAGGYPLVSELGIYGYTPSPYYAFRGVIDDVRVYTRALSASEVAELHSLEAPCMPHAATATATIVNGFVVGINITDLGCGYTSPPSIEIIGGGGAGAGAYAVLNSGSVTSITVTNAGAGYTSTPAVIISPPAFRPWLSIAVSKVAVAAHVSLGQTYFLESSSDLINWVPAGPAFTPTNEVFTQEFDVQSTGQFFRIVEMP
jgi:hypothetical protein